MQAFLRRNQQERSANSSARASSGGVGEDGMERPGSNAASPNWGIIRARSMRQAPTDAGAEDAPPRPRPTSIRRISEVAIGKVRSGMGLVSATASWLPKRKSSMRVLRRATSKDEANAEEEEEEEAREVRTSSARMSRGGSHSPELEPISVQCGGATCRGRNKKRNEDRLTVLAHLVHDTTSKKNSVGFAAVYDGHGGDRCVEHISVKLPTLIGHHIFQENGSDDWQTATRLAMARGIQDVDREFYDLAVARRDISGACGVMATVRGSEVTLAHVGDCRAVMCKLDGEPSVSRLTRDHVVTDPEEIERIRVAGGKIVDGRLNGVLTPTRAFGDADVKQSHDGLIVDPEVRYLIARAGSVIILCSDGITGCFSDEAFASIVLQDLRENSLDPSHAAATLCRSASEIGTDDCSAVVIVFQPPL